MANLRAKYQEKLDPQESVASNNHEAETENTQNLLAISKEEPTLEEEVKHGEVEATVTDNKNENEEENLENDEAKFDLESLINKANSLKEEIPQLDQKISELAEVKNIQYSLINTNFTREKQDNKFDEADELQTVCNQKQSELDKVLETLKEKFGVQL